MDVGREGSVWGEMSVLGLRGNTRYTRMSAARAILFSVFSLRLGSSATLRFHSLGFLRSRYCVLAGILCKPLRFPQGFRGGGGIGLTPRFTKEIFCETRGEDFAWASGYGAWQLDNQRAAYRYATTQPVVAPSAARHYNEPRRPGSLSMCEVSRC